MKISIDGREIKYKGIIIELYKDRRRCNISLSLESSAIKEFLQSKAGLYTQIYTDCSQSIGARSSMSLSSAIASYLTGIRSVELDLPEKTILMPAASVTLDQKHITENWSATATQDILLEIKAWNEGYVK